MNLDMALDHLRTYYRHNVKPFEKLPEIIEVLKTAVNDAAAAEARRDAALTELAEHERAARQRLQALGVHITELETRLNAKKSDLEGAIVGLEAQTAALTLRRDALLAEIQTIKEKGLL